MVRSRLEQKLEHKRRRRRGLPDELTEEWQDDVLWDLTEEEPWGFPDEEASHLLEVDDQEWFESLSRKAKLKLCLGAFILYARAVYRVPRIWRWVDLKKAEQEEEDMPASRLMYLRYTGALIRRPLALKMVLTGMLVLLPPLSAGAALTMHILEKHGKRHWFTPPRMSQEEYEKKWIGPRPGSRGVERPEEGLVRGAEHYPLLRGVIRDEDDIEEGPGTSPSGGEH